MENVYELLKKPFLNEKEAAALTGRAVSTLRNDRCLRKGMPYLRVGERSIRYRLRDVLEYMEKQRITFEEWQQDKAQLEDKECSENEA